MPSYETSTIDTIWMGKGLFEHPTFSMTMVCTKFYLYLFANEVYTSSTIIIHSPTLVHDAIPYDLKPP